MKKSKKIALSAIFSALGVLCLFAGSVVDVLSMTLTAVASMFTAIIMIEIGGGYPWLIWGVTSALSLILLPNKLPALLYFLFGGIYPILKAEFERFHPIVGWLLKFSVFNTALLLLITLSKFIFYLNDSSIDFTIPIVVLGNVAFFLYDIALSKLILVYIVKLRHRFGLRSIF